MPSGSIWIVKSFMAFMDAVLLLCTAIKLKSFFFNSPYCASLQFDDAPLCASMESSIDRWLHFAVGHNVEEVSLILHNSCRHNSYVLPQFMFRCPSLFIGENVRHRNFDAEEVWNSAEQRIYMHLKNVEVDYDVYWFQWEPIRYLLKFLVQNAPCLDKIEIVSNNSN
ncbi:hypothetical protein NL676_007076 [Syzygium grande]|nr:hypothetical protein NL676_007076 [Syzygium grande]